MTLFEIKSLLSSNHLSPRKKLGQNFLIDQNLAKFIVRETLEGVSLPQEIYEIGPGLGSLTEFFLQQDVFLKAIEIDRGFCKILLERFSANPRFELIQANALDFSFPQSTQGKILVGNLPYSISSPLLAKLALLAVPFPRMIFTLQQEVASRLMAKTRTKDFGALSVLMQYFFEIKKIRKVPKEVFYPVPKIESAVVFFEPKNTAFRMDAPEKYSFYAFVRRCFSQRRKKIGKILHIPLDHRPDEIPPECWANLWMELKDSLMEKSGG
ncbi:ribosomal RNA small subunit methyltransferase A [Candidatus Methylacidiphilum infernorum]|uniref:Ribosomal RNA small subunit methyltransferase A n=1 Tax=Candidatus Methylacidiphilum infernorum TaxID=511746 RepID=A0ABX7PU54_9BACT|nr:16S rRNA (adenine(1518)-N(6)/adenine(1519)-N(6))-dimethyltransferase RsmA [Candidatus Methylacidiphilum infernorum]QSR86198.1 ribosomal RNA small subunit methyltransferase A [Candidatus Methylacidiphilum infernorum]